MRLGWIFLVLASLHHVSTQQTQCPLNSVQDTLPCICEPGFRATTADDILVDCTTCDIAHWCQNGVQTPCTLPLGADIGSTTQDACTCEGEGATCALEKIANCTEGQIETDTATCLPCPPGYACAFGRAEKCHGPPDGSCVMSPFASRSMMQYNRLLVTPTGVYFVTANGQSWGWGSQIWGQLGLGLAADNIDAPAQHILSSPVLGHCGDATNKFVLLTNGIVVAVGSNEHGLLGLNTADDRRGTMPAHVASNEPVLLPVAASGISYGDRVACALLVNNRVKCWGRNTAGEVSPAHPNIAEFGTLENPISTSPDHDWGTDSNIRQVHVVHRTVLVLLENNTVYAWGSTEYSLIPGLEADLTHQYSILTPPSEVLRMFTMSKAVACFEFKNHNFSCWGNTAHSTVLNAQPLSESDFPLMPLAASDIAEIYHLEHSTMACMRLLNNDVQCWGVSTVPELAFLSAEPQSIVTALNIDTSSRFQYVSSAGSDSICIVYMDDIVCYGSDEHSIVTGATNYSHDANCNEVSCIAPAVFESFGAQCTPPRFGFCPNTSGVSYACTTCSGPPENFKVSDCTSYANEQCTPCSICSAGYHKTMSCSETSDTECEPCPPGSWCANEIQNQCIPNSHSLELAATISDCKCLPGNYLSDQGMCEECRVDHWCPGGGQIFSCPNGSISLHHAANASSSCVCGPDMITFNLTSMGPICINPTCPSPNMLVTESGRIPQDCYCRPAFYENASGICEYCPPNHFCPGDHELVQCPENTNAPAGSNNSLACTCSPSFYFDNTAQICTECPENSWCFAGIANACPFDEWAPMASHSLQNCTCRDGYGRASRAQACVPCVGTTVQKYQVLLGEPDKTEQCQACGENMQAVLGNTECQCMAGWNKSSASQPGCDVCQSMFFQRQRAFAMHGIGFDGGWRGYIMNAGKFWGWGDNTAKVVGPYTATEIWDVPNMSPLLMGTNLDVLQVAPSYEHVCVLFVDGSIRCAGSGSQGKLGRGDWNSALQWGVNGDHTVVDLGDARTKKAVKIAVNMRCSCAVLDPPTEGMKCWGENKYCPQITDHGTSPTTMGNFLPKAPLQMSSGDAIIDLSCGWVVCCVVILRADLVTRSLQCWGNNAAGLVHTDGVYTPNVVSPTIRVRDAHIHPSFQVHRVYVGSGTACILSTDGRVKCYGSGMGWYPILGFSTTAYPGTVTPSYNYIFTLTVNLPDVAFPAQTVITSLALRTRHETNWPNHAIALDSLGRVFMWNTNLPTTPLDIATPFGTNLGQVLGMSLPGAATCLMFTGSKMKCEGSSYKKANAYNVDTGTGTSLIGNNNPWRTPNYNGQSMYTCEWCKDGFVCANETIEACIPCTAGMRTASACSYYAHPSCAPCTSGTYSTNGVACLTCQNCSAGNYRTAECTLTSNTQCASCPANNWCANNVINQCHPNSFSPAGSDMSNDCICASGFWGNSSVLCQQCPLNAWCSGGQSITQCPLNSITLQTQSNTSAQCVCKSGFKEVSRSASGPSCLCWPGTFQNSSTGLCDPCPFNAWCSGGQSLAQCPLNSMTLQTLSNASSQCVCKNNYKENSRNASGPTCLCRPGLFLNASVGACQECPFDHWCAGHQSIVKCSLNAVTLQLSSNTSAQCVCHSNYKEIGRNASGPDCLIQKCPKEEMVFPSGGDIPKDCTCRSTYFENASALCELCLSGYTCPGNTSLLPCPENASSPPGSNLTSQCTCDSGFYGPPGGPCMLCPLNSWCDLGVLHPCGPDLAAPTGSGAEQDCSCHATEYYDTLTQTCTECPIASWCDSMQRHPCGLHATSFPATTALAQCFCEDDYYGLPGVSCLLCPVGTYSMGGNAHTVQECLCLPSTHGGVSASGETNCTLCDVSYFCPGDGLDYACPSQKLTVPRFGAISQADCKNPTCGNGILELGEECDDGPFSGRGCSTACQFEDACDCAAGPQFVCNMTLFGVAGCCSSLRNPVTLENVCTCKNQVSDYAGYKVRSDCSLQEIDECNIDNGGCNLNAICMNLDGLLKNGTHECRCPPGLIGDGVVRCDIFLFETQVGFNLLGISLSDVNTTELIDAFLAENAALMAGKNANDVRVELQEYIDSLALRHRNVLQDSSSGVTIKIIISSNDALQMENFTSATDALGIAVFLQDFYQAPVEIESEPTSAIQTMDAVYGTVNTIVTGFNVLDISYNKTSLEWLVRVQYVPNSPNTIASMYVTKANSPPYTQTVKDSFMISKHPCMQSSSACCLTSYAANYHIGSFAQNISRVIGPCSLATQMADTYGMFDPSANAEMLLTTLEGLPYSYVTRLTPTTLLLHINRMALQDKVATRTPFAGGFVMDFFVGMSYYTLLPTNAIATVASQAKIQARFTDALVFATSTEQDYSLAEYITLALFQTKYAPDLLYEHKMQYVRVSFVLPESVRQNMDTGLIPLSSIRFAIAKALPASEDTQQWQNPCYSSDNTALFDNSTSSMRYLYTVAAHQTCALQPRLCQNPPTETLTESGLIEFWFPLGDGAISSTETAAAQGTYSLFVYFNLATVTGSGRGKRSVSRIFAQAPLSNVAITKACESLGIARTVNDVTEVDLNVGITGTDEDWLSSVTSFRNLVSRTKNDNYADTGLEIHALSMQSSLLTLALRGSDAMFNSPVALPFHLEIEDMLTLHFLDDTKYQQMLTLLKNEQAWTLVRHQDTGYLEIALTAMGIAVCSTETMPGDFTCAVRRNIYRRQVVTGAQNSVHALATGVNSHNEHATVSWLQQNLLGVSGFSEDLARNFTRLVRSKHNINDRYNKAWFVNPMYNWATAAGTQSVHALSDKTIVLAVVALDDESKLFGTTRRMLLQATSASQGPEKEAQANTISKSPSKFSVPPLTNKAVNADREIAKIIGIDGMFWVKSGLKVVFNARSQMTAMQVRDEIQARLNRSQTLFASESGSMHLTQFLMQRTQPLKSMPHRRLMAKGDVVPWVGTVNLFWSNLSAHTTIDVYMNWLHCALWLADLETDRPGAEIPDCTQQTTDPMRGFVTSMWTETCNNYSFAVENCSSVLRILDSNGSLATANVPKPPAKNTTANVGHVLAFQLAIAFIDVFTNAETLSAWTQAEMQRVIALEFEIPSQQVVLETLSSDPLSSTRRRLQSAYMLWHVFGPASWRPQTSTIAEGITEAIQRDLGMQVTVEFVDFAPETTPALKEAKKDSNTTLIIVIVVSCVGSVGVISIITYMCIKHPDGIGHVAVTTQQARFEYRPLNSNYVESRTRHLGYGIPNHNLHSPQRHRD